MRTLLHRNQSTARPAYPSIYRSCLLLLFILLLLGLPFQAQAQRSAASHVIYLPLIVRQLPASCSFLDDFTNPSTNWLTFQDAANSILIQDGKYQFKIDSEGFRIAHPGTWCTDVTIDLDTQVISFQRPYPFITSLRYGIVFGYLDANNWYAFEVSPHSQYRLVKHRGDDYIELVPWTSNHTAINFGEASNHLQVRVIGSTITLVANENTLNTITDSSFEGGYGGVSVGAGIAERMEITLDNFSQQPTR